ncbi:MAG: hypothetical protein U0V74_17245 [Chitinophagales bacterium]
MKRIYYSLYVYFKMFLKEHDPHFQVSFLMGVVLSVAIQALLSLFLAYFFCRSAPDYFGLPIGFSVGIFLIVFFLYYYDYKGKGPKIIAAKPLFFNNNIVSVSITIIICVCILSYMYWGPMLEIAILKKCN